MLKLAWRHSTSKSSSFESARLLAAVVLGAKCPHQLTWSHSRRFGHTCHPLSYSSRIRHRSQPAHCFRYSLSLLKLTLDALCILRSFGKLTTGWFSNLICTKRMCCVFVSVSALLILLRLMRIK